MGTTGQSITLANSIIGVGILAMPFCFQQCGVFLATIILLSMGLISRLCCYFLLKSALLARRRNFEFLAFHVFGSAGKMAVEVGIIGFLMGTCIAYFVVVGDLGPQIVSKMFNINQSDILRTSIMVIVSLVCVLPLGLLRNVDSLSNVSAATICFYVCLVMKVIAEAASQLLTGDWQARVETWKPSGVLQCVPIFSMALFCQTQLFEIFESLPTLSLEKMNLVTKNAINICTGVYFTLGLFGYIAFSAQDISGNILMSLSPTMASDVIKLGFVMSVAFSFPLIIFPCRASLYSLLYKKVHSSHHDHIINHSIPERSFRCLTVGIVAAALFVSLLLPNIELVLGLVGSTIGVLVCVVFPAACFVNVTFKNTNERLLAKAILILGLIIMVLGTYANLQAAENQIDKYDDKYITKERIDKMVEDFFQNMEKSDNVVVKPEIKTNEREDTDKINKDVIKESMALPPNPVPPESQSNEKVINKEIEIKPPKLEVLPQENKETVDKVSETHPRNLNKITDTVKTINGDNKAENIETPKEEAKPQTNEEKINMIKQQQLIETIKQHGEEQKELIKEQKEILTEIKKTKQELEKSKSEAAEADAKKIAVESIKKIANVAIQSLASVSDKPGQAGEENVETLEKIADEAVQEIAQKAVETIEAIKEIEKEKTPENVAPQGNGQSVPVVPSSNIVNQVQNNIQSNQNVQPNVPQSVLNNIAANIQKYQNALNNAGQNTNLNQQPPVNVQPSPNIAQQVQNAPPPSPVVAQPVQNVAQPVQSVVQPAQNVVQPVQNVAQPVQNIAQPVQSVVQPAQNVVQPVQNVAQPVQNIVQPVQSVVQPAQNVVQPVQNEAQPVQNIAQPVQSLVQPAQNVAQPVQNVVQPVHNVAQPVQNVAQPVQNVVQPVQNVAHQNVERSIQNIAQSSQNEAHPVQNVAPNVVQSVPDPAMNIGQNAEPANVQSNIQAPNNMAMNQAQNTQKVANSNVPAQNNLQNQHSHSPDEPQSYQQGEDTQKNNAEHPLNNVAPNVPLPLAVNGNSINQNANNIVQNVAQNAPVRQKREVVDCTAKSTLRPEDREICKTLVDNPHLDSDVKNILASKVDLSEIALPKNIAIQQNVLHHISRSLKMYDDKVKR